MDTVIPAEDTIVIARRFHGPPDSGNGGYVGGRLAALIGEGPVEVTLRAPPPLDRPLAVAAEAGGLKLMDGTTLLAEARPASLDLPVPAPVGWEEAQRASSRGGSGVDSEFNDCFVCGRGRHPQDGLRVWAGRVPGRELVAAAWQPDPAHAEADGWLPSSHIWGALDCPGASAVMDEDDRRPVLTGRMVAEVTGRVRGGERCVVIGWPLGKDGRKLYSGTAVFNEAGALCGRALITWIVLKQS